MVVEKKCNEHILLHKKMYLKKLMLVFPFIVFHMIPCNVMHLRLFVKVIFMQGGTLRWIQIHRFILLPSRSWVDTPAIKTIFTVNTNLRKTNQRSSSVESTGRSRMKKHSSILSRALEQIPSLIYILMDLNWNLVRKRGKRCAKINCTACGYMACPFKALFIFYHLYCRRERWRRRDDGFS